MSSRYLFYTILCVFSLGFALVSLLPVSDRPFPEYLVSTATSNQAELEKLVEEAEKRVEEGKSPTVYVAVRDIALERNIDIPESFFPGVRVDPSIKTVDARNRAMLRHLLNKSRGRVQLGLDLKGGASFGFALGEREESDLNRNAVDAGLARDEDIRQAISILRNRIDATGVAEPIIRPVGKDRIEVQLPGVSTRDDPEIINSLRAPAQLSFAKVHPMQPTGAEDEIPPAGYRFTPYKEGQGEGGFFTSRIPAFQGKDVTAARAIQGELGQWKVILSLSTDGANQFYELTRELVNEASAGTGTNLLAIVLDGELISAPRVQNPIPPGNGVEITGQFTAREAQELANNLNNPLSVPLVLTDTFEIGPSMAQDAVDASKKAVLVSMALLGGFMVVYYGVAGVIAMISIAATLLLSLATLSAFGATLTLPSIAALVLTAGMASDANILIFERIREELRSGKKLVTALAEGHRKVLSTIIDANITSLITALVLVVFGTGPVKGFGVTLSIGIVFTVFSALIISRLLLELSVEKLKVKRLFALAFVQNTNIQFFRHRRMMFALAWIVIGIGLFAIFSKGERSLGVDFTGGDDITLSFAQKINTNEILSLASDIGMREVVPVYASPIGSSDEILRVSTGYDQGEPLLKAMQERFPNAGFNLLEIRQIGPSVGVELTYNAIISVVIALLGILLYIALRFELGYGVGAVVALVHVILITIGICVFFDFQFSAPMVAAILMVVGYSLNDTIVTFDRVREELTLNPTLSLAEIINLSLNRVLGRTVLTGVTTLLTSLALYVFGRGVVTDFAFVFSIGVVVGVFSTIYIATSIFYWFHKGDRRKVEERHDALPRYDWEASSSGSGRKGPVKGS